MQQVVHSKFLYIGGEFVDEGIASGVCYSRENNWQLNTEKKSYRCY